MGNLVEGLPRQPVAGGRWLPLASQHHALEPADELLDAVELDCRQIANSSVELLNPSLARLEGAVDLAPDEEIAGKRRLLKTPGFIETLDGLGVLDNLGEFANVAPGGNHGIGHRTDVDILAIFVTVIGFRFARHPGKQAIEVRLIGSRECRMIPVNPGAHRLALENLAKQVVLLGLQLIAVITVLVGIHQRQCSHRQVEFPLAHAESLAHCVRIAVKVRE